MRNHSEACSTRSDKENSASISSSSFRLHITVAKPTGNVLTLFKLRQKQRAKRQSSDWTFFSIISLAKTNGTECVISFAAIERRHRPQRLVSVRSHFSDFQRWPSTNWKERQGIRQIPSLWHALATAKSWANVIPSMNLVFCALLDSDDHTHSSAQWRIIEKEQCWRN